jgi:hypothetical protein
MLKFFMSDGKWGANDVAEGVDYPRTLARFRTRNMTFRLTIFTVVVRARCCVPYKCLDLRDQVAIHRWRASKASTVRVTVRP